MLLLCCIQVFSGRCFIVFLSESDIYEDPSVRFESKKILQPDPTNMENYLVKKKLSLSIHVAHDLLKFRSSVRTIFLSLPNNMYIVSKGNHIALK